MTTGRFAAVLAVVAGSVGFALGPDQAGAQAVSVNELTAALSRGGYVLVMRHASAPREAPTKQTANADNTNLERQLDEAGRKGATAMGDAIRALKIPLGDVLTSPTYRALETVQFARLPRAVSVADLGDRGQSMQGATEAMAAWLRTRAAQTPRSGNTLLVTHSPNLAAAFPDWGSTVADGETVVLRPDGKGGTAVVGRVRIEDWPRRR